MGHPNTQGEEPGQRRSVLFLRRAISGGLSRLQSRCRRPPLQQFPYHADQSGRRTVIETPRNNTELFSPTNLPWESTSGPPEKPGYITV